MPHAGPLLDRRFQLIERETPATIILTGDAGRIRSRPRSALQPTGVITLSDRSSAVRAPDLAADRVRQPALGRYSACRRSPAHALAVSVRPKRLAFTVVGQYGPAVCLVDLRHGFRDEYQQQSAQAIVMQHLADDREQEECRVLMKFSWQLAMTYQEVTEADLDRHVSRSKRDAVQRLIDAIRHSPDAIDAWIADMPKRFPPIRDRGYETWHTNHHS